MQKINNNLIKIIELLNDQQYHDSASIGDKLNITRASVCKTIRKLEHYGIAIKSTKDKGYFLEDPLILLNAAKIKSHLHKKNIYLDILEDIASTNEYLKHPISSNKKTKVCIAETQTQGKGRLNHKWYSPFGQNIYLSLYYSFTKDISKLSGLSLIVGLAVCRAINSICRLNNSPLIKWPNDIVVNQRKLAGILVETQSEHNGYCHAIIGIGVNVNMYHANTEQIDQKWSSLQKITGQYQDRNFLCAALINQTLDYLDKFVNSGLKNFIQEWGGKDSLLGQPTQLISNKIKFNGIGAGINPQGHLILKMPDNTLRTFSSGDTTLLKKH